MQGQKTTEWIRGCFLDLPAETAIIVQPKNTFGWPASSSKPRTQLTTESTVNHLRFPVSFSCTTFSAFPRPLSSTPRLLQRTTTSLRSSSRITKENKDRATDCSSSGHCDVVLVVIVVFSLCHSLSIIPLLYCRRSLMPTVSCHACLVYRIVRCVHTFSTYFCCNSVALSAGYDASLWPTPFWSCRPYLSPLSVFHQSYILQA